MMLFNRLFPTFIIPCGKSLVKAGICRLLKSRGNVAVKVCEYVYAAEVRGYHQGNQTPPQGW